MHAQVSSDLDGRVRRLALGVPIAVAAPGAALSLFDARWGLVGAAVVLGWTKLVGI